MKDKERIQVLEKQIYLYKKAYYAGKSIIPDFVYDALEDELKLLNPQSPALETVGAPVEDSSKVKVKHLKPMLSLEKTYSREEFLSFFKKHPCVLTDKLDGMAMSLEYSSKGIFFQASTRGDGKIGENATDFIALMNLPFQIEKKEDISHIEIRGEVYFPLSKFEIFRDKFDSYRNAVPGTFGRKHAYESKEILKELAFFAYDVLFWQEDQTVEIFETYMEKLEWLEKNGFHAGVKTGRTQILNKFENFEDLIKKYFGDSKDYEIDGLVARINHNDTWNQKGSTSHHPKGSLAFKQDGDMTETFIRDIEMNVGRSGKLTFRAKLEPVYLSNALISYASLHNAQFILDNNYGIGAKVKLKRSGEVIPSIIGLVEEPEIKWQLPEKCVCGGDVYQEGPDCFCKLKENCPCAQGEFLVYFAKTIGIEGISDKIIEKLIEANLLQEPADYFKLTLDQFLSLDGFKTRSSNNALKAIEKIKEVDLGLLLASMGLVGTGLVKCQELASEYLTLEAIFQLKEEDIQGKKGWGETSARNFVESLKSKRKMIENLLQHITIKEIQKQEKKTGVLLNKKIGITGSLSKPRKEIEAYIEELGGKASDSVSKDTFCLICNEVSSSSKYVKAQKLNIPILSETEFFEKYLKGNGA